MCARKVQSRSRNYTLNPDAVYKKSIGSGECLVLRGDHRIKGLCVIVVHMQHCVGLVGMNLKELGCDTCDMNESTYRISSIIFVLHKQSFSTESKKNECKYTDL